MLVPTLIMFGLAFLLLGIAYSKGDGAAANGLKSAAVMTRDVLPLLIAAFIVAGMAQALLPKELVARWVGDEAGYKGILIGTLAGGICPGGPYVSLPIAMGLVKTGAGIGTIIAFITAWSLWAIMRLPLDLGILGPRITAIRLACTFFFPPIAGLLAQVFFSSGK